MSNTDIDQNDYMTISPSPIMRAGVFPYRTHKKMPDALPNKIYNVYRPLEELQKPETMKSFECLPIVDDHTMLGKGNVAPENHVLHGVTGENIQLKGNDLLSKIKIYTTSLQKKISNGKRGLSMGYHADFVKQSGVFDGVAYDYVFDNIHGNHLAVVNNPRNKTFIMDESEIMGDDLIYDQIDINLEGILDMDKEEDKKEEEIVVEDKKEPAMTQEEKDKKDAESGTCDSAISAEVLDELEKSITEKVINEIKQKTQLEQKLSAVIGVFDSADMSFDDMIKYGCEKLQIDAPQGQGLGAITGYLAANKKSSSAIMDSAIEKKTNKTDFTEFFNIRKA